MLSPYVAAATACLAIAAGSTPGAAEMNCARARLAKRPPRARQTCADESLGRVHQRGSTILTSQVPVDHWHEVIADPTIAEHAPAARVVLAANSRLIQQAACKAGLGVAILPCVAADREPDLIQLLPPARVASTKLWLVAHRDTARSARVRAVMDFVCEIVPK